MGVADTDQRSSISSETSLPTALDQTTGKHLGGKSMSSSTAFADKFAADSSI